MSDRHVSSITTLGVLPISPGHTVQISFYDDSGRYVSRKEAPVVVDLDTGITYGQHWHFRDLSGAATGVPVQLPSNVRADLPVRREVSGRVVSTQVAWININNHPFPQTTLLVEVISSS